VKSSIRVFLPDGAHADVPPGTPVDEVFRSSGLSLESVVAGKLNGALVDMSLPVSEGAKLQPVTLNGPEGLEIIRHSTSHIMAHAVKELFPDALPTIGPATAEGFYYDFYYPPGFTEADLEKIQAKMKEIIKKDQAFRREELSRADAIALFKRLNERFKLEILQEIQDEKVTVYHEGDFVDLCRGPHIPSASMIRAFRLLSVAGAYWRGDEKQPMLQRIYGTAFPTEAELEDYIKGIEEAKKRDHRRLGKDLDLFSINEGVGPGFILWHPKGALIRTIIEDYWRVEHRKEGYELVYTPHLARLDLWKRSGHVEFYKENMYSSLEVDDVEYEIKPMNCPFHIMIYKSRVRSYRDLPLRWAELGTVYRYERSGVLHGLMRVRGFTQDDAHIFMIPDQLEGEIIKVLDLTLRMLGNFGFREYDIYVSTRPERFAGTEENWKLATGALEKSLKAKGLEYKIDPGEGVFYGPKIDLKIKDVLGRSWQCTTIQVDFNLPERFDITYVGEDNSPHRPIMIHRAVLGSMERFLGVLIEHYGGAFPLWLSPVQVVVISLNDDVKEYAEKVAQDMENVGLRLERDFRSGTLGHKIRDATMKKVPYMVIVGRKEQEAGTISVRTRGGTEKSAVAIEDFIGHLLAEQRQRASASFMEEISARKKN